MTKAELRKMYFDQRRSLSVEEIGTRSRRIADRFFESFELSAVGNLHCFISIEKFNEIDTSPIFKKIWNEFPSIRTFAPRLDREAGELHHHVYTLETKLVENAWGIREPADAKKPIEANEIDLVLVPLLCFDVRGYRVGYGKGFYDKFLVECRPDCFKVGLSFFPPVDRIDDVDKYDIPLDHCVTPETVYGSID
jgi:5-formyltetrahydrofolate cyclo-ligase